MKRLRTVKIRFEGFWPTFQPEEFFLTKILRKHYDVQICQDADYVICSAFDYYAYIDSPEIRIFFSGENYIPDFNFVDYGISVYPMEFGDRHFSFPGLVLTSWDYLEEVSRKDRNYSPEILKEKPCFVNLIAGHESEKNLRSEMFRMLSQYKRVEAGGSFLNNMPGGERVQMRDGTKLALQKKCKFTMCGESLAHEGFITEKIFDAFLADTIPIYYGSSTISQIVNKDAFIDLRDYDSLEAAVERIIELDQNDEAYLNMLRQPVFVRQDYVETKLRELEAFVLHIFEQPYDAAYRRARRYVPASYEDRIRVGKMLNNRPHRVLFRRMKEQLVVAYWSAFEGLVSVKRKIIPPKG